jgi:hypothetical protein
MTEVKKPQSTETIFKNKIAEIFKDAVPKFTADFTAAIDDYEEDGDDFASWYSDGLDDVFREAIKLPITNWLENNFSIKKVIVTEFKNSK